VPDAFDLVLDVSPEQVRDFAALQDALDEGERLAAAGRLLVHAGCRRSWPCATGPASRSSRSWAGCPPRRGAASTTTASLDVDVSDLATEHGWDDSLVRQAAGGAVAVDDANRVISISRPSPRRSAGGRRTWSVGVWWRSCRRASARPTWRASAGT
jgi:hypothetical protein